MRENREIFQKNEKINYLENYKLMHMIAIFLILKIL